MHSLTKRVLQLSSLLTRLPCTCTTAHHWHYFQTRRQQQRQQQPELVNDHNPLSYQSTGEERDRKVLQDKWGGSNFWSLPFKGVGRKGVYTETGYTDFHLGALLGQYFTKPGVCNLLIKVLTLGQLTRLISPWRHVLWPQGKLKQIQNILN